MKNYFIYLLLIISTLSSCNKDPKQVESSQSLNGEWSLVNRSCFCDPINFVPGDNNWNFDVANQKLMVTNQTAIQSNYILPTGSYDFQYTDNQITINEIQYDYYFQEGKLYLGHQHEADGPLLEFTKN